MLGSYCTGKLIGQNCCRQGVIIEVTDDQIIVQGQLGIYVVETNVAIVPDENLFNPETLAFVKKIRESLILDSEKV